MNDPSATATAEAPSGKHKSAAARGVGGGPKGRKQAAADARPGAKKPAPAQRPKTARSKPAAGGRAQSRSQPADAGRPHPEMPRRKPTRRNQPKPPPAQQQATSPPGPAARKPDGGPVEPAAAATPQATHVGRTATATPETPPPVHGQAARLRGLVERANAGDDAALADLQAMLDAHPEIWGHCGDLGRLAEEQWLDALCTDALGRESIRRHVHKFKVQLAGPQPTDLEWVMAQEVAACWLAKKHAEAAAATPGGSVQQAAFRSRRLEGAQKAYLRAVKTLMMLRLGCR